MSKFDYDMIVVGGGAAGLTGSGLATTLGAKTMMIEQEKLGGDCTWYGCVPSKTLLKAAKVAHHITRASNYGLSDQNLEGSFSTVLDFVRQVREDVYHEADDPDIYTGMGIDVRFGAASFVDSHTIEIRSSSGVERHTSRYFLLATGAKAWVPPIPGIDEVGVLTNETLFELTVQPQQLLIVGGGPIGIEMAQSFRRLGSDVTVVDMIDRILAKDNEEMASVVQSALEKEGVRFELGAAVNRMYKDNGQTIVEIKRDGAAYSLRADAVLMATGRRANIGNLNLEAAGVKTNRLGISVNRRCRTNVKHIYAAGDVTGEYQFTHMSEHMAKVAVTNAIAKLPTKMDTAVVPWVTYTQPEVAHVGKSEKDLVNDGGKFKTYRFPYTKLDRAITDSETGGMIKVYAKPGGKILGVDIVGEAAGELISEYALAMKHNISLRKIADTIHAYPTYALGARRAADQWYVQKQSPRLVKLLKWVFRYRGPVLEFGPDDIL